MTQLKISAVNLSHSLAYGSSKSNLIQVPCVEIQLSDGQTFKGDGLLTGDETTPPATLAPLVDGLTQTIVGQPAHDFLQLCRLVSQSKYTLNEMRFPDPAQKSADERKKDNRREMLSMLGVLGKEELMPVPTDMTYPMPRHLVRGATAALLRACAHTAGLSTSDYLRNLLSGASEESAKPTKLPLGIHVDFAEHSQLLEHASALCYAIPPVANAKALGKEVEVFQKYLRQLNGWIEDSWSDVEAENRPWLFVDLNGAVHKINNESSGKTLGSLYGFGTTGNQEKMIFSNVVTNTSATTTAKDQVLMQSMTKSRKLKLSLAAGCWTNSLENVQTWLEKAKPKMIVLNLNETASMGELIEMIQQINGSTTELILQGSGCGNQRSWDLLHQVAQAAQPFLYLPAGRLDGTMQVINGRSATA